MVGPLPGEAAGFVMSVTQGRSPLAAAMAPHAVGSRRGGRILRLVGPT